MITVQLGQCGNQLGASFYDILAEELQTGSYGDSSLCTYFREAKYCSHRDQQPATARAVLVDMEPKVIAASKQVANSSRHNWTYDSSRCLWQQSGSGNNWAQGYYRYGPQIRDGCVELVRKEAEACDVVEGFLMLHSMAGGTGAGFGTYLAEALHDEFKAAHLINCCVWPYESGEVNVQPYNTLLTLSHLSEVSDGIILTQNEVLHATCTKLLGLKTPSFADLNRVAARCLASVMLPSHGRPAAKQPTVLSGRDQRTHNTATAKLPSSLSGLHIPSGANQTDAPQAGTAVGKAPPLHALADLAHHLCSHPRFKLVSIRSVPQMAAANIDFTTFSWGGILKRLRNMAVTGSFLEEGMSWAPAASSSSSGSQHSTLPIYKYKNKAVTSMVMLRGQGAFDTDVSDFLDPYWHSSWSVDPVMVAAHTAKFNKCPLSASLLANDQASLLPVRCMQDRAYHMLASRAFLHQYETHGLLQEDFNTCFTTIEETLASYAAL
eukprot:jgi/Chrzof1/1002/Cz01g36130.t1